MSERTKRPETPILTERLLFPSFQARFYRHGVDRVAKVYNHQDVWDGVIPLGDELQRAALMSREVTCLKGSAPSLNAQFSAVQVPTTVYPYREVDTAIVMDEIPTQAFLESKIQAKQPIDPHIFAAIARRVADFHFDVTACPRAEVPSMAQYLQDLMSGESQLLLTGAEADERKIYNHWGDRIAAYIDKHSVTLEQRREVLGEPVVGHGDIKASNMVYFPSGEVGIIDPAPVKLWQINDRRMDAGFFRIELELMGLGNEAATYWQAYNEAYNIKLSEQQFTPAERKMLEHSHAIIDTVSDIYRLTIFHRLAVKKGVNPQCGPVSKRRLEEIYSQIENGTVQ